MRETNRHHGSRCTSSAARLPFSHRPRVLFLSCHLPWPPLSGGRRRELELIKRIAGRFDVHLLVVSKTPAQDRSNLGRLRRYCRQVEVFPVALHPVSDGRQPRQVLRHRSPDASERVRQVLAGEGADLIHVEGFYLMQHVPDSPPAPVLLVEQNIEYELEQQPAAGTAARELARITEQAERGSWRRASRLAAVTAEDAQTIQAGMPGTQVAIVPDGADHLPHLHLAAHTRGRTAAPLLVLVANFGYAPNVDAATYFCHQILPSIRRQAGDVEVWLVGNAPPPEVRRLASDSVSVTGAVPDVVPYLDAAEVIVCPLRIGGGIKVKTLEALRRGKPIVSSSVGAQGLPPAARAAMVISDDPAEFADRTSALLRSPEERIALGRRAARASRLLPTWDEAARRLTDIYDELLHRGSAAGRAPAQAVAGAMR